MRRNLTAVLAADVAGYSRLMSEDADATLATLRRLRTEILGPVVAARRGRVIKSMGDGWIVTFDAVTDAVECAMQAQDRLKIDGGMQMRVGIHIGDVAEADGDVFGDGVNVAARLQEIAEPGSVVVSDAVFSMLDGTQQPSFRDVGERVLKNIPRPVRVWLSAGGSSSDPTGMSNDAQPSDDARPKIRFVTTDDGAHLAYATSGSGPGLIRVGHFPSHLELEWQEAYGRVLFDEFGRAHTLFRFDQRGTGLSDLDIDTVNFSRTAEDMIAIADAASLDRFAVVGSSGSGSVTAVHLAARHPDRVSALVLLGGCVNGRASRHGVSVPEGGEPIEAMLAEGWDTPDSPFIRAYMSLYFPDASEAKLRQFARNAQQSCPKENAIKNRAAMNRASIEDVLGQVRAPTLIVHARGDTVHPISEGRKLASGIAGAEMVVLDSRNHYPLPDEPCWADFRTALRVFLEADAAARREAL